MAVEIPPKIATQIAEGLDRYRKPLRDARARNATEGDTGLLVHSMLADVFGYDRFTEVTSEFKIKGQFADFVTKNGDRLVSIIEVKAIGLKLNEQHLFQAAGYAAREGVEWVVLTNAIQWDLYRVEFSQPVNIFRVLSLDCLDGQPSPEAVAYLHKWGMQKGLAEAEWQRQTALSAANIVKAVLSEEVLRAICSQVRKATSLRVDAGEMRERIIEDVIRTGLVGQVAVSEVTQQPQAVTSTRRIRLKSLVAAGFLVPGEELVGEWEGSARKAEVIADGTVKYEGRSFANLDELTRSVTNSTAQWGWTFWSRSDGESMLAVRERYIAANP